MNLLLKDLSFAHYSNYHCLLPFAESLLLNIQGLLKVAAENTRQNERQAVYERSK